MEDKIFEQIKKVLLEAQQDILLQKYTTFKIGGPAKYFFVAKTKEDLMTALKTARDLNLPVFIFGGGSNLLISEKGFKGLVIKIEISGIKFQGSKVAVGAGTNLTQLAYLSADRGLAGMEWGAGIPGTIGGSIFGNAQAFGEKISDTVETVQAINLKTLKSESFSSRQCNFHLKESIFKKNRNLVIISAVLKLNEEEPQKLKNRIKEFLEYRRNRHPMNFPSAGSVFVNAEAKVNDEKLLKKFPDLKKYNKNGVIPAGYLVEKSGLAGKKIGNAQISEKHANFIINLGRGPKGCPAKDVLSLINLAKKKVKKIFKINLEVEVQFVGFKK